MLIVMVSNLHSDLLQRTLGGLTRRGLYPQFRLLSSYYIVHQMDIGYSHHHTLRLIVLSLELHIIPVSSLVNVQRIHKSWSFLLVCFLILFYVLLYNILLWLSYNLRINMLMCQCLPVLHMVTEVLFVYRLGLILG